MGERLILPLVLNTLKPSVIKMEMPHLLYVKVDRDHPKETFLTACCGVSEVGGSSPQSLEVPLNESWHWGLTHLQVGVMG